MKRLVTFTNTLFKPLTRTATVAFLTALLLSIFSGCGKETTRRNPVNACELIQKEEVERVVGSPIKDAQSSVHPDRGFVTSDCLYSAAEFSKSVSFSVSQKNPESTDAQTPKDFWKKTFGRFEEEEREAEEHGSKEKQTAEHEEEESPPPKKIGGIGDEAFWMKSGLYVLKKDVFIRVSVGGAGNEESKIEKSKALAAIALKRL